MLALAAAAPAGTRMSCSIWSQMIKETFSTRESSSSISGENLLSNKLEATVNEPAILAPNILMKSPFFE